jgi:hypothetical protein
MAFLWINELIFIDPFCIEVWQFSQNAMFPNKAEEERKNSVGLITKSLYSFLW